MQFLVFLIAGCLRLGIPIVASLVIWNLKPASAAEITLSDLDHAKIDFNVLVDRHVQLNGRPDSDRVNNNWHLSIEGTSVNEDFFAVNTDGPHAGPGNRSHGSSTIGKPHGVQFLGGGEGVWIFDTGKLIWLRTYREGAFKLVVNFNRASNGLTCSVHAAFPREGGIGAIEFQTAGRGQDIKLLSVKVVGTNCHVHTP